VVAEFQFRRYSSVAGSRLKILKKGTSILDKKVSLGTRGGECEEKRSPAKGVLTFQGPTGPRGARISLAGGTLLSPFLLVLREERLKPKGGLGQ